MTFVLSFPRYTFTHLGCHLRQTGLDNLYTPYLCIGHMQVNTLDHVYGRCILRWRNLTSSYTLSSAEAPPVRLVGQSSKGVPGLPSPSIHSPSMPFHYFTYRYTLRLWCLAWLLLSSEEDSEAVFENYWSPVSHSSVGSACRLVSPQFSNTASESSSVEGYQRIFSCYHDIIDCGRGVENLCLLSEVQRVGIFL